MNATLPRCGLWICLSRQAASLPTWYATRICLLVLLPIGCADQSSSATPETNTARGKLTLHVKEMAQRLNLM
jgi:hypothetical protein